MPHYVITARDGTDPDALARRMAARPAHLANVTPLVEAGQIIAGGAMLDDAGRMIGSVTIAEFADRAALDHWLATDPYVVQGVWQTIDIQPFRLAVLAKR